MWKSREKIECGWESWVRMGRIELYSKVISWERKTRKSGEESRMRSRENREKK